MSERMSCLVPFCRRSRGLRKGEIRLPSEWICGPHWSGVSKQTRRRKNANAKFIRRELRRQPLANQYWLMPPGCVDRVRAVRMWGNADAIWRRCKREAIEAAGGIR